jgi:hypothetical protein
VDLVDVTAVSCSLPLQSAAARDDKSFWMGAVDEPWFALIAAIVTTIAHDQTIAEGGDRK